MRDRDQEPVRLRHELGTALEHALLSAGASSVSSGSTRAKTLAALGLASSATLLAGMAAGAGGLGSAAKVGMAGWAKVLVGVSALGAASAMPVGYYYVQRHKDATAIEAAARPAAARVVAPAAPVEVAPPAVQAPVVPRSARTSVAPRGELTKELAALDRARATLSAGDARGALAVLDSYSQSHPAGRLELEAEVLRIEALAKSGRVDLARERGQAFLRRHPQSVLAERVRAQIRNFE